jgi:uncharacterized membrane protein YciS (DUF1049 family)
MAQNDEVIYLQYMLAQGLQYLVTAVLLLKTKVIEIIMPAYPLACSCALQG